MEFQDESHAVKREGIVYPDGKGGHSPSASKQVEDSTDREAEAVRTTFPFSRASLF